MDFKYDSEPKILKQDFKHIVSNLKEQLYIAAQKVREQKKGVIIIIEGLSCAGKGEVIAELISELDPKFFNCFSNKSVYKDKKHQPVFLEFLKCIPQKGMISIIDRCWYQKAVDIAFNNKLIINKDHIESINIFERQLICDGYVIIKVFLCIDKVTQKVRLTRLCNNSDTRYRVTPTDFLRLKKYNKYKSIYDVIINKTNTPYSKWYIINSQHKKNAKLQVIRLVLKKINKSLCNNFDCDKCLFTSNFNKYELVKMPLLETFFSNKFLEEKEYDEMLDFYKGELNKLQHVLYTKKIPLVIGLEGLDTSGKTGAIKRICSALDPRGYNVVPVEAPNELEKNTFYLKRFMSTLPSGGNITIYDRTWYGRVLVEKVDKLTDEKRVEDAYNEINEFEYELYKSGICVIKFWLNIDLAVQNKRFIKRGHNEMKSWKLTEDDLHNRENFNEYIKAADKMISKTSTIFSPWHIIESNDKKFARIKMLKTLCRKINEIGGTAL